MNTRIPCRILAAILSAVLLLESPGLAAAQAVGAVFSSHVPGTPAAGAQVGVAATLAPPSAKGATLGLQPVLQGSALKLETLPQVQAQVLPALLLQKSPSAFVDGVQPAPVAVQTGAKTFVPAAVPLRRTEAAAPVQTDPGAAVGLRERFVQWSAGLGQQDRKVSTLPTLLHRLFENGRAAQDDQPAAAVAGPLTSAVSGLAPAQDASFKSPEQVPAPAPVPAPQAKKSLLRPLMIGVLAGAIGIIIPGIITAVAVNGFGYQLHSNYMSPENIVIKGVAQALRIGTGGAIIAPIAEEVLFRGGMIGGLAWLGTKAADSGLARRLGLSEKPFFRKLMTTYLPLVVSSAIFVVVHETGDPLMMAARFIHALILGYVFQQDGLLASSMMHIVNNSIPMAGLVGSKLYGVPGTSISGLAFSAMLYFAYKSARALWKQRQDHREGRIVSTPLTAPIALFLAAVSIFGVAWPITPVTLLISATAAVLLLGYVLAPVYRPYFPRLLSPGTAMFLSALPAAEGFVVNLLGAAAKAFFPALIMGNLVLVAAAAAALLVYVPLAARRKGAPASPLTAGGILPLVGVSLLGLVLTSMSMLPAIASATMAIALLSHLWVIQGQSAPAAAPSDAPASVPAFWKRALERTRRADHIRQVRERQTREGSDALVKRALAVEAALDLQETGRPAAEAPPAFPAEPPAAPKASSSWTAGLRGLLLGWLGRPHKQRPSKGAQYIPPPLPVLSTLSRVLDPLPAPVRVGLVAGAVALLDFAARALAPAVFGFSAAASLWAVVGVGVVIAPLLLADRLRLAEEKDAAVRPLQKREDVLLGVFFGAALVLALGLAASAVPVSTLLLAALEPFSKAAGVMSLAPFLGLLALVAAVPLLYGSGHMAWALRNHRVMGPVLPLDVIFRLLLINTLWMPGNLFMFASGTFALPIATVVVGLMPLLSFFMSGSSLLMMSKLGASKEALAQDTASVRRPWTRGLNGEAPRYGPEWRIGNGEATGDLARGAVRSTRMSYLAALGLLLAVSVAFFGLTHFSLGAFLPEFLKAVAGLKNGLPVLLTWGFLPALFFGAKKAKPGPLVDTVAELADKAGLPKPGVFVGADESKEPNSLAAGILQRLSTISILGSLRKLLTPGELRAFLAHELSHLRHRAMAITLFGIVLLQTMLLSSGTGSILQSAAMLWGPVAWTLALMLVFRAEEFMADAESAALARSPRAMGTGLRKTNTIDALTARNAPVEETNALYRLLDAHPTIPQRIAALNEMMSPTERK
jgi:heat shock protein HtpX